MTAPTWTVHHGDCLDIMAAIPPASIDAIVTDPPYGLGFMGHEWDALPPGLPWARECIRVLKPGGHVLAFGGTRTYHRLAVALEDAGFDIRDTLAWLYGSGFPKSLDVAKAIDATVQHGGSSPAQLRARDGRPPGPGGSNRPGHGAAGKAARDDGTPTAAIGTADAQAWDGWGTALKPAYEPVVVARKPLAGTVARNVLAHGTGALNIDGARIATDDDLNGGAYVGERRDPDPTSYGLKRGGLGEHVPPPGRWPANVALDEEAAAMLDAQTGELTSGANPTRRGADRNRSTFDAFAGQDDANPQRGKDTGGASRFLYVAKPSTAERNAGLAGNRNTHPTVKPAALMAWLVRLVTPPGGTVLDPFTGSGSTGIAALREGFGFVGIEREAEYVDLARARIIGDAPLFNQAAEVHP